MLPSNTWTYHRFCFPCKCLEFVENWICEWLFPKLYSRIFMTYPFNFHQLWPLSSYINVMYSSILLSGVVEVVPNIFRNDPIFLPHWAHMLKVKTKLINITQSFISTEPMLDRWETSFSLSWIRKFDNFPDIIQFEYLMNRFNQWYECFNKVVLIFGACATSFSFSISSEIAASSDFLVKLRIASLILRSRALHSVKVFPGFKRVGKKLECCANHARILIRKAGIEVRNRRKCLKTAKKQREQKTAVRRLGYAI